MPGTRRRAPRTVLLLGLLAGFLRSTSPALALPSARDQWIRVQTAHFTLFSNAGVKTTKRIGLNLETLQSALTLLLKKIQLHSPLPTRIFVFANDRSFLPYKIRVHGAPANVSGFFVPHRDGNYVAIDGSTEADPSAKIHHEFLHYSARADLPRFDL